jgi:hypothetical protein
MPACPATRTLDSGEAWEYEYNRMNEVIRGIKKQGATPLDGYDFGYGGTGYLHTGTGAANRTQGTSRMCFRKPSRV